MHTPHLTPEQIQAYAAQQLANLRRRAAEHVKQARARMGDVRNLTLGSLVDTLADEAAHVARTCADLALLAEDSTGADAILADLFGTHQALTRLGLDCRMASIQTWPVQRPVREWTVQ